MEQENKSPDVQPISRTNPHIFDLNKPSYDEEEFHPKAVLKQKESKSENVQSSKTFPSTIRNFDLNQLHYEEGEIHPNNAIDHEFRLELLKIWLPSYFKVWVIF